MVLPYFLGVNSFACYSIKDDERRALLDECAAGGITVVRIFITEIESWKFRNCIAVDDLEQHELGRYEDRILELIDVLMVDCHQHGLKLTIAIADTWKCQNVWGKDKYFDRYGSGRGFYLSEEAQQIFDNRIRHVLAHRNPHLGNKPWAELDEVIFSLQAHNEPMGHMNRCRPQWTAEKARVIKSCLPSASKILVSTGGGTDASLSIDNDHEWTSPDIDIVCLHSYEDRDHILRQVKKGLKLADQHGKHLIVEEIGYKGERKASEIKATVKAMRSLGVPFLYWQAIAYGKGEDDYEIAPSEVDSWQALLSGAPKQPDDSRSSKLGKFGKLFGH